MRANLLCRQNQTAKSAGFTLVEVMMVIAIVSIVFGSVYRSFDIFNRSYTTENVKAGVQQKTRIGVDLMARDIRLAGLDPLGLTNAGFISGGTNSSSIQFSADHNYDGDLDDPFENITYALNGDILEQTSDLGSGPIAATLLDNVTDLTFTYLDASDTPLIEPVAVDEIRTVLISLTLQRPAGRQAPVSRTYTARIRCRNL
ncbi:MAG: prepilin-type N-terminal cleavage/methylation domain-containing protein [Desulfobacterales bacterium]|jgi:prepilin-type N-terminal cleavage/methylation domain-containing protein